MCNEFAQERAWKAYCEMMAREDVKVVTPELPELPFTANRRPTDPALVIRAAPGGVAMELMRWGVPKPGSKRPLLWMQGEKRRDPPNARGIVPIEMFVEHRGEKSPKERFEFRPAINEPLGMATYVKEDRWAHLTVDPGGEVFGIHDRQPAIIRLSDWWRYLTEPHWPADLIQPSAPGTLKVFQAR